MTQSRPDPRANPLSTPPQVVRDGLAFLREERNDAGWWTDFWTPAGVSDEWVTAFAASSIAPIPGGGRAMAEAAWRLLSERRTGAEGWSYGAHVPGDADSTAWALTLASALGRRKAPAARRGEAFLRRHLRSGGVATYHRPSAIREFVDLPESVPFDGWCSPHTDVTAAACGVLPVDERQSLVDALAAQQQPDGSFVAYWWLGRAYVTALSLMALAPQAPTEECRKRTNKESEPTPVLRALRAGGQWCLGELRRGLDRPAEDRSAYDLAWLVRGVVASADFVDGDREGAKVLARQALESLKAMQVDHGGWLSGARLRVPTPMDRRPEGHGPETWRRWLGHGSVGPLVGGPIDHPGLGPNFHLFSIDQNAAFTTASVLAALHAGARFLGEAWAREPASTPAASDAFCAAVSEDTGAPVDPFSEAFRDDPYPGYRRMREQCPVAYLPSLDAWGVSRFADVRAVLKDHRTFSSSVQAGMDMPLLSTDPPAHTRIRRILARVFSPARVGEWEQSFHDRAESRVRALCERGGGELVTDLTRPLTRAMAAKLLAVGDGSHDRFMTWCDDLVDLYTRLAFRPAVDQPARLEEIRCSLDDLRAFFLDEHLPRCQKDRLGILGELLADGRDREVLNFEEALSFAQLFLVAGTETSRNLLGNLVLCLLDFPESFEPARRDPRCIAPLIEESMRYDPAVQLVLRRTVESAGPVEIGGSTLPRGARVAVLLGSANRDDQTFDRADAFRPHRRTPHLGLGTGAHFCLGAHLARAEARALLGAMLKNDRRWSSRVPPKEVVRIPSFVLRGPERLDLQVES